MIGNFSDFLEILIRGGARRIICYLLTMLYSQEVRRLGELMTSIGGKQRSKPYLQGDTMKPSPPLPGNAGKLILEVKDG